MGMGAGGCGLPLTCLPKLTPRPTATAPPRPAGALPASFLPPNAVRPALPCPGLSPPPPAPCAWRVPPAGKIDDQIQRYIGIKTLVSAAVGLLVFVVLGPMLHIKLAHLFAILHFLLNFVPNVGPVIATGASQTTPRSTSGLPCPAALEGRVAPVFLAVAACRGWCRGLSALCNSLGARPGGCTFPVRQLRRTFATRALFPLAPPPPRRAPFPVLPLPLILLDLTLSPSAKFLAVALPTAIHGVCGNVVEPKVRPPLLLVSRFLAGVVAACRPLPPSAATCRPHPLFVLYAVLDPGVVPACATAPALCCAPPFRAQVFGRSMELHPVVVLMALAFWFSIWGVVGAILSIPVTAVIRIILSHSDHAYARVVIRLLEGEQLQAHTRARVPAKWLGCGLCAQAFGATPLPFCVLHPGADARLSRRCAPLRIGRT